MTDEVISPEQETGEVEDNHQPDMSDDTDMAAAMGLDSDAKQVPLNNLNDDAVSAGNADNLDGILDLPVSLSVEIGKTRVSIKNLLQLNQGSVVELDRLAGEALDVMVNNTLVAHGEIVMVNEKYGIRLTDVVSARERVQNL